MSLGRPPIAVAVLLLLQSIQKTLGVQSADSKYDFGTTIFSPEGRIYQVEYAFEAINRARPAVGICTDEGVVLCSLKTIYDTKLQLGDKREKISLVDSHAICASAGLTADAMVLVRDCRATAQQHSLTFQEPIPLQKLAAHLADVKQAYTQHGGLRPWGVSMLLAGWDDSRGPQLYETEPSGNFGAFKVVAVGAGASRLSAELASGYRKRGGAGMRLAEALRLAVRVLAAERRRRKAEQAFNKGGAPEFGDIGMEIATIALEEVEASGEEGRVERRASAYIYSDAEVDKIVSMLDDHQGAVDEDGDGGNQGQPEDHKLDETESQEGR